MARFEAALVLIVVCGAVISCRNPTDAGAQANLRISGTVTSAEDGTPLPGIVVELWAPSHRVTQSASGPDGTYSLQTGVTVSCVGIAMQAAWDPGDGYRIADLYFGGLPSDTARFSQSLACKDEAQVIDINLLPG